MKKYVLIIVCLLLSIKLGAQTDSTKLNRSKAIEYNLKGVEFQKNKEYKEAIRCFNKALEADSTFGEAYYNRAISIVNSNPKEYINFDKCNEFKKAIKYGKAVSKEELFFYGCTLKY